jgi:very-short-patch-repair endonuclease
MLKDKIDYIIHIGKRIKRDNVYTYEKKKIMTDNELYFYNTIQIILEDKYILWPQINLASVIKKKSIHDFYNRQNELYRNIDFGIFSKDTFELLLLIEINDNYHNIPKVRRRDHKVNRICEKAGYEIITFWTNQPNMPEYIENKIFEKLNNNVNV